MIEIMQWYSNYRMYTHEIMQWYSNCTHVYTHKLNDVHLKQYNDGEIVLVFMYRWNHTLLRSCNDIEIVRMHTLIGMMCKYDIDIAYILIIYVWSENYTHENILGANTTVTFKSINVSICKWNANKHRHVYI